MYERMLNKQKNPTLLEMASYCGKMQKMFLIFNEWLSDHYKTNSKIVFPYGNNYGWGVAHKQKGKLICNVFAEKEAFTVMMRLSNEQFEMVYANLSKYTQKYIDNKYPCSDGGWIHYRILCEENMDDIKKLLILKCV